MMRYAGLILLIVGIVVAAASGARNGERHVQYREAQAKVDAVAGFLKLLEQGKKLNEVIQEKEGRAFAEMGMDGLFALPEKYPELAAQIEATEKARLDLEEWGVVIEGRPETFGHVAEMQLAKAEGERDAIGLPLPGERFQQWFAVGGPGLLGGLALIVAGALLARRVQAAQNAGTGGSTGRVDFPATLAEILERLDAVAVQIADLPMDAEALAPRAALDALAADVIEPMVELRGQLVARHGLAGFAEYFGPFSAGERNLNRAWSALTDGHAVVAREALGNARVAFEASDVAYREVEARG